MCENKKLYLIFRSHESLLTLPSKLFYDGELVACADPLLTNHFLQWKHLPNPQVPLIFQCVCGEERRDENDPSFFNPKELIEATRHAKRIVLGGRAKAEDVVIITPYKKQAQKFRLMLNNIDLKGVTVSFCVLLLINSHS